MATFIFFLVGVFVGSLIQLIFLTRSASGTLKIDHSNPEKDVYLLEIEDLDSLSRKDRIVVKVDNKADLSHK